MEALLEFLKANPVVAVGIGVLVLLCGVSFIKKLIKLALALLVVTVVALAFVNNSAEEYWEEISVEGLAKVGERAMEVGEKAVEKAVAEGKKAIEDEIGK